MDFNKVRNWFHVTIIFLTITIEWVSSNHLKRKASPNNSQLLTITHFNRSLFHKQTEADS